MSRVGPKRTPTAGNRGIRPLDAGRSLQLLSSPSRAAGPPKAGEKSLLDFKTQSDYRNMIQERLNNYQGLYPLEVDPSSPTPDQKERSEDILILFRKLREGIVASSRTDDFALEVYEDSACWSVIFRDQAQSTSIFTQIPMMRRKIPSDNFEASQAVVQSKSPNTPTRPQILATLHLVHLLRIHYPSQKEFQSTLLTYDVDVLPPATRTFLRSLASTIRRGNFIALSTLTDPQTSELLRTLEYSSLPTKALLAALKHLREAVRADAWRCVQSAYRDLSIQSDVQQWLTRALCLGGDVAAEEWMESKIKVGEVGWKQTGAGWTLLRSATPAK